jgi:Peroxisomal membrane protein (Pex16)
MEECCEEPNAIVSMNGQEKLPSTSRNGLWNTYQRWVLEHERSLWLVEESLSRLLFWAPPSTRGRETILGLLELHRLLVQCAKTTAQHHDADMGTSVDGSCDGSKDIVSTRSLRLGIGVIQSVWPVAQELVCVFAPTLRPSSATGMIDRTVEYRQAVVRQYLERLRFLFRITLLVRYWKRIHAANKAKNASVLPGLLLRGGGLDSHSFHGHPLPYQVEQARIERMEYVGRRTGRRVVFLKNTGACVPARSGTAMRWLRIVLSELLYILRPLVQAEADVTTCFDATSTRKLRIWSLCLGMDVLSLLSVGGECSGLQPSSNAVTVNEWKRRRMRLFLYVLRSPIWDRYTEPVVQRVDGIVYRFPLVGGLLRNFIWDWIYYWRVFRAEEG